MTGMRVGLFLLLWGCAGNESAAEFCVQSDEPIDLAAAGPHGFSGDDVMAELGTTHTFDAQPHPEYQQQSTQLLSEAPFILTLGAVSSSFVRTWADAEDRDCPIAGETRLVVVTEIELRASEGTLLVGGPTHVSGNELSALTISPVSSAGWAGVVPGWAAEAGSVADARFCDTPGDVTLGVSWMGGIENASMFIDAYRADGVCSFSSVVGAAALNALAE